MRANSKSRGPVPKALIGHAMLAVSVVLSACGGGGGENEAPAAVPANPYLASSMVNTPAPAASYAVGSEEAKAFALLNAERLACGFGSLRQNTALDSAALGHVNWMVVNNYAISHYQEWVYSGGPNKDTLTSAFTGITPLDRVRAARYDQSDPLKIADEGTAVLGTSDKTNFGMNAMRALLGAPYHLAAMMGEYREVGLSVRSAAGSGADITVPAGAASRVFLWADLGYSASSAPQLLASDSVVTYPCQGTTGTIISLSNESPNPVLGRNLAQFPLGQPIYLHARIGNTLRITSAQMTKVSNSANVLLRAPITSANDPDAPCQKGCYLSHMAYVVPDAPLEPNTQYRVVISGTNNGAGFTKNFTFTTGNIEA